MAALKSKSFVDPEMDMAVPMLLLSDSGEFGFN